MTKPKQTFPWPKLFDQVHLDVYEHLLYNDCWIKADLDKASVTKFKSAFYRLRLKILEAGQAQRYLKPEDINPVLAQYYLLASKIILRVEPGKDNSYTILAQRDKLFNDYFRTVFMQDLFDIATLGCEVKDFEAWREEHEYSLAKANTSLSHYSRLGRSASSCTKDWIDATVEKVRL